MGQGSSNMYAPLAAVFQDLERLKFTQDLRQNPAEYQAYVNTRIDTLTNEIFNQKRAAFQKAHIDLARYMDMDHNAAYYKTRSADVDRLTTAISQNNMGIAQALARDKDISRRQFEINEWFNYNKLETLFFLQVFFIAALSMAIIVFLQKNATITNSLAGLLTLILFVGVAGLGLYRYFYTTRTRDPRLWHRRYFATSTAPPKAPAKCDNNGNIDVDINTLIPKEVTQCADEVGQRFGQWQESLQKEILAYQSTGATPSKLLGGEGAGICKSLSIA